MVFRQKMLHYDLLVEGKLLTKAKEFSYLSVLFTSNVEMEYEMYRQIGVVSAVLLASYWTVVVKKDLSQKAKLLIYQSINIPTLSFGQAVGSDQNNEIVDTSSCNKLPIQGGWTQH